ncbi:hypothetical protein NL676_002123 [Syzygium grande]|nr:hypothetical protein NL676_002123 [Syzygium grande]
MAEAVVSFLVDRLANLLVREVKLWCGLSGQLEDLCTELKRMQRFLRDADARQDEGEMIQAHLAMIREVAYDAADIIDTFAFKITSQKNSNLRKSLQRHSCVFKELVEFHQLGSELEAIKSKISSFILSFHQYGMKSIDEQEVSDGTYKRQPELRRSYSYIEEDVVGFEEDIKKLVEELVDEKKTCPLVAICGMGGLGKTTIAKKVYHNVNVRHHFDRFAWVYVSRQCQVTNVLRGMLYKLISFSDVGRDQISKLTNEELVKEIYQIMQKKKCLVILDAIWSVEAWNRLSPAFPLRNGRSKILITSRVQEVAKRADPGVLIHEPRSLDEEQSWQLLQKRAFPQRDEPELHVHTNIVELGKKMLRSCAGLPLAITVLGVSKVLALSYRELPYRLKPCFLYLSHFPEDSDIPTRKLIQMWMADGIVSEDAITEEVEDIAETYLYELIDRGMVQVAKVGSTGRVKVCRLHDLMRELCLFNAKRENFFEVIHQQNESMSVEYTSSSTPPVLAANGRIRRLALSVDRKDSKFVLPSLTRTGACSHLWVLLYSQVRRFIVKDRQLKHVFNNFKLLRVLDLQGMESPVPLKLPKDIENLIHLRFLSFRNVSVVTLELPSSIGNLKFLQTLDLSKNSLAVVPNVIWKIEGLRNLYLPRCCYNFTNKMQLGNLRNLQILVNFPAEMSPVTDLLKLTNLRKLELSDPRCLDEVGKSFKTSGTTLSRLQSLSLKNTHQGFTKEISLTELLLGCPHIHKLHVECKLMNLPTPNQFPPSISKLSLEDSELEEDPMPILGKLPNLNILCLIRRAYLGNEMVCSGRGFPQLKSLVLNRLDNLKEWKMDIGAMPCLSRLEISDCNKLMFLPRELEFATCLQQLEIKYMPFQFKKKFDRGGEEFHIIQHVSQVVL